MLFNILCFLLILYLSIVCYRIKHVLHAPRAPPTLKCRKEITFHKSRMNKERDVYAKNTESRYLRPTLQLFTTKRGHFVNHKACISVGYLCVCKICTLFLFSF